ncbi:MAG: VCBS repeat-containing protein, partial [Cyclobacteriaceae bacterium]|nr:VCBS repeat-containing protein [Cyclobacteriaceae bacterium]
DLVINNLDENALLYKNNAMENGAGNYIRFKLNLLQDQNIYGTKVKIYQNDKLWQMYQITNVRGFRSKSEDIVHFGVGKETEVDKVVVEWQNGAITILTDLATNQLYEVNQEDAKQSKAIEPSNVHNVMFKDVANYLNLSRVTHRENNYDDYSREILLPHKMSQFGPPIGIGDVNGDNREDFYIGGPAGISGTLFIQNRQGKFDEIKEGAWTKDKASEDMDISFIDVDADNDLDMMVVSGGNEFNPDDAELQDRLYINNGRGEFRKKANGLPEYLTSGSCVVPNDFDKDGDIDLFIGGRLIPRKYPHPANSHLLENRGGRYVEVTEEKAPGLSNLGLVTAATWTDHNNDGLDDLVIVGEWMPITIFTQFADGHFEKQLLNGLADSEGWYYEVQAEDIDGDGDEDFVV